MPEFRKSTAMRLKLFTPALIIIMLLTFSCRVKEAGSRSRTIDLPGPRCIVYKTKQDYRMNVPVELSEDRKQIISYPAPTDLLIEGNPVLPDTLTGGYLLDNRGIGPGVAFISDTYGEYISRGKIPAVKELEMRIIDRDPLLEMYDCGLRSRYGTEIEELNRLILSGGLVSQKRMK